MHSIKKIKIKFMDRSLFHKIPGFTLIEILVSLTILAIVAGVSCWLISYSVRNYRLSSQRASLELQLYALTNTIADDFSCIVLGDKGFPNLEIKKVDDSMNISFFTSNNDEHVTKAITFVLKEDENHLQSLSRRELSASDSLFLQNTLNNEKNLGEIFARYKPEKATILCKNLLNFHARLAIQTSSGGIFFCPTNSDVTYKQGCLTYKTNNATGNIRGDLLFVDVTVRALSDSGIPKFHKNIHTKPASLNTIPSNDICKSFRRIAIKGRYF